MALDSTTVGRPGHPDTADALGTIAVIIKHELVLAIIGGLFVAETLMYTGALTFLDVSTAYPIGSLSFVAVTVLSHFILGERVTRHRWIGVGLILLGASLVVAQA